MTENAGAANATSATLDDALAASESSPLEGLDYGRFGGLRATFQSAESVPPLGTLQDGAYKVNAPGGHVHFLVQGSQSDEIPDGVITAMFHGDLSNRKSIKGPFFAGRGVQRSLGGGPIVCFSDPVVELDESCTLAWFAGSAALDVPNLVSSVIDSLTGADPRPVWLVGGSGGGFASINIGHRIKRPVSIAVWNPQSSIAEYNKIHVGNYLKSAFPELVDADNIGDIAAACSAISAQTGRDFDVSRVVASGSVPDQVLLLQNYNDWHVVRHAPLLLDALCLDQKSPGIFADASGTRVGWFTELGNGHAAPNTDVLIKLLKAMYSAPDTNLELTVAYLDSAELFPASTYKFRPADFRQNKREISRLLALELEEHRAAVVSDYVIEGQHRLTYRFTLHRDGAVFSQSELKPRMDWPMFGENSPIPGDIIEVEVRDGFGHPVFNKKVAAPQEW